MNSLETIRASANLKSRFGELLFIFLPGISKLSLFYLCYSRTGSYNFVVKNHGEKGNSLLSNEIAPYQNLCHHTPQGYPHTHSKNIHLKVSTGAPKKWLLLKR